MFPSYVIVPSNAQLGSAGSHVYHYGRLQATVVLFSGS